MNRRRLAPLLAASLLLLLSLAVRVRIGAMPIGYGKIAAYMTGRGATLPDVERRVIAVRLRHGALVALVGAGLAAAGCAYQAALRNALADPFILGVSAGAALSAAAALTFEFSLHTLAGLAPSFSAGRDLPVAAFAGAMLTIVALLLVHRIRPGSILTLVLAGVALNSFLSAALTILMYRSSNLRGLYGWLLGSIEAGSPETLAAVALVVLGATSLLLARAGTLNALLLDRRVAASLGLDEARETAFFVVVSSVIVAAVVATSGMIGFVGLLAPHAARMICGSDHRILLPFSFLLGGFSLVACDAAGRLLFAEAVPVGVITSFLGAPFFIYLLVRKADGR